MNDKRNALWVLVGMIVMAALFMFIGFMVGKAKYDKPIESKVERDTVTLWDTVPYWYPKPVKVWDTKTEYKWLTRVTTDTITNTLHDSVLVEVPITSKHYNAPEYDAYISGYMPNLDSIFLHQKTEYITERITISKPPNKVSLNVVAGADYFTNGKDLYPYVVGDFGYNIKDSRWSVGIQGGVYKAEKTEPFGGGYIKFRIF